MSAGRSRETLKRKLLALLLGLVAVFSLTIELGHRIPSSGIPDWNELFAAVGFKGVSTLPGEALQAHYIDVGNADCALVRQGDANLLIDAGERGDGEKIVSYLREQGVEKLDLVIATHPHADHIGGMATVIRAFPVETFVMAFMPDAATPTSAVYLSMLEALDDRGVSPEEATVGARRMLGEATVELLGPVEESDEPNNMSVVTRVSFGGKRFLFMGDAESAAEEALLSRWPLLTADVLKVGHHGSKTATSEALLTQISPSLAVIPCGAGNSYGHPDAAVLERLIAAEVKVLRNDLCGTVVISVCDGELSVQTEKEVA